MTTKQRQARAKFKAAIKEAGKLRKKNPGLTQAQAVKQAWAILYSKEKKGEKIGYSKEREKLHKNATVWLKHRKKRGLSEDKSKKEEVSYAYQQAPFGKPGHLGAVKKKSATKVKAKKRKSTEMHTDTKSHNVNIRVVSGIDDQMIAIRNNIEKSIDYYMSRVNEILNSYGRLEPKDKILAKKIIKRYKTYVTKLIKQLRETNQMIANSKK